MSSDAPLEPGDATTSSPSSSPDVGLPSASAALGGEVAGSCPPQPTHPTIDLDQKIYDILQSELGNLTDLDNQNKILLSMNLKITAKILSIVNTHHQNCCGSQKNLDSLSEKITKLEKQCGENEKNYFSTK